MKLTDRIKHWFAKSKNKDMPTSHFEEKDGIIRVHQDSADNTQYRVMQNLSFIGSITLPSGQTFIPSVSDIAILPMTVENRGYNIDFTCSGAKVFLPFFGALVLIARGNWDIWRNK